MLAPSGDHDGFDPSVTICFGVPPRDGTIQMPPLRCE